MTIWKQKGEKPVMHTSGPREKKGRRIPEKRTRDFPAPEKRSSGGSGPEARSPGERGLVKVGFAVAAGILIAALAKGVKDSDYYD